MYFTLADPGAACLFSARVSIGWLLAPCVVTHGNRRRRILANEWLSYR
jgi:hypothetical protein